MSWVNESAMQLAPRSGTGYPRSPQLIADAAGATQANATALAIGAMATLQIGAQAVRATFYKAAAGGVVGATDMLFAANTAVSWLVEDETCFVYVAEPGGAAYEAWVWPSSPGMRRA